MTELNLFEIKVLVYTRTLLLKSGNHPSDQLGLQKVLIMTEYKLVVVGGILCYASYYTFFCVLVCCKILLDYVRTLALGFVQILYARTYVRTALVAQD